MHIFECTMLGKCSILTMHTAKQKQEQIYIYIYMCVYMYITTYDGVTIVDDKEWNPFG